MTVLLMCKQLGVSDKTYYRWRACMEDMAIDYQPLDPELHGCQLPPRSIWHPSLHDRTSWRYNLGEHAKGTDTTMSAHTPNNKQPSPATAMIPLYGR